VNCEKDTIWPNCIWAVILTNNRKILLLVEDKIKGKRLFTRLLNSYGIFQQHQIVSYKTNIYSLYNSIFRYKDHDYLDILTHLREHEIDHEKKLIFNERYTDIILVFDLDPQEPNFESEKIIKMLEFFNDSTEMGKLYIDYPMIEAFHHMYSLPDPNYYSYFISFNDIKQYKSLIKNIVKNQDHKIFKTSRAVFNIIINQNLEKAWHINNK